MHLSKRKLNYLLPAAIIALFAALIGIFVYSTLNRHVFTVYADGDYISQALIDEFTKETGIRVRLVTGGRTPEAGENTFFADESGSAEASAVAEALGKGDSSAEPVEEQTLTLPQLLQAPRDEAEAKARELARKNGDESAYNPEDVVYPPAEYDVVLTDGATLGTLREQGLIKPLTYSKVTNLKNISSEYRKLSYDPTGEYTITTMWEYVGLLVNTNVVQEQIKSWDVLWDERYAGAVAMPDQMRDALAVTLLAMGENPASTDPVRLNAALDKLEAQKPLVASYSNRDAYILMQNNRTALYPCWSGDALAMMRENPALVYMMPPGGTYRTTFGYAVPTDTEYEEKALQFINFMCSAQSLARNAVYTSYASTSNVAMSKMDETWTDNPVIYPELSVLAQTPLLTRLPEDTEWLCALRWKSIIAPVQEDPADQDPADQSAAAELSTVSPHQAAASTTPAGQSAAEKAQTAQKEQAAEQSDASASKEKQKQSKEKEKPAAGEKKTSQEGEKQSSEEKKATSQG